MGEGEPKVGREDSPSVSDSASVHFYRGLFAGIGLVAVCTSIFWAADYLLHLAMESTEEGGSVPLLAYASALLTTGGGFAFGWLWKAAGGLAERHSRTPDATR